MKYRVVGWTAYDNPNVKDAECTEAAMQAIIHDIRKHHYKFTGWDHQEMPTGAPVLNDGCMRLFSQRGFGHVMAWAQGDYSRMGYVEYAFDDLEAPEPSRMPPASREFDPASFTPETDLHEAFTCTVDDQTFSTVLATKEIKLPHDDPAFTMIDPGDTLTVVCGNSHTVYRVLDAVRCRDMTEEEELELYALTCTCDFAKMQEANDRHDQTPRILKLALEEI